MQKVAAAVSRGYVGWHVLVAALIAGALLAVVAAPQEQSMGDVQRILYIHVSVAWLGLLWFVVTAGAGIGYLLQRDLKWDHSARSAAELGWLCSSLTLITGSLWAQSAWGTWWTWEPRLLSSFVLWALYCGYLMIRGSMSDPHQRARLAAVVAVLGVLDVPLVIMATRWFRGIHPVAPQMEPAMRATLLLSIISFTAFFATLFVHRRSQIKLEHVLSDLEHDIDRTAFESTI